MNNSQNVLISNYAMQQNYGGVCTIHSKYKIEPDWSLCFFHNVGSNMISTVVMWNCLTSYIIGFLDH